MSTAWNKTGSVCHAEERSWCWYGAPKVEYNGRYTYLLVVVLMDTIAGTGRNGMQAMHLINPSGTIRRPILAFLWCDAKGIVSAPQLGLGLKWYATATRPMIKGRYAIRSSIPDRRGISPKI